MLDTIAGENRTAGLRVQRTPDIPALDPLIGQVRAHRVVTVGAGLAQPPGQVLPSRPALIGVATVEHRRAGHRHRCGVILVAVDIRLGQNLVAIMVVDGRVGLQLLAGGVVRAQAGLVAVLDSGESPVGGLLPPTRHHIQRRRGSLTLVVVILVVLSVQRVDVGLARRRVALGGLREHGGRICRPVRDRGGQRVGDRRESTGDLLDHPGRRKDPRLVGGPTAPVAHRPHHHRRKQPQRHEHHGEAPQREPGAHPGGSHRHHRDAQDQVDRPRVDDRGTEGGGEVVQRLHHLRVDLIVGHSIDDQRGQGPHSVAKRQQRLVAVLLHHRDLDAAQRLGDVERDGVAHLHRCAPPDDRQALDRVLSPIDRCTGRRGDLVRRNVGVPIGRLNPGGLGQGLPRCRLQGLARCGQAHRPCGRRGHKHHHADEHRQGRQDARHAQEAGAGWQHQAVTSSRIRSVSHSGLALLATPERTIVSGFEDSGSITVPHWMNTPVRARLRSTKARHWASLNPRR